MDNIRLNRGGGHKSCQFAHSVTKFGRNLNSTNRLKNKIEAFTLAEVLITLAIIGVVAALTIPSIITSYKDKQYNTARLKALKTFGDAGKMASVNNEINGQPTAKDFANNVLSRYLKIAKVCNTASECDFPNDIQPSNPSETKITNVDNNLATWKSLNDSAIAYGFDGINNANYSTYITTADGFSAKLFYNPNCTRDTFEGFKLASPTGRCLTKDCSNGGVDAACMNIIYDMNGTKSPNHAGKDIGFVTVFWSGLKASAVAPDPTYVENDPGVSKEFPEAVVYCASKSTNKIQYGLPSVDELTSLFINTKVSSIPGANTWSGSNVLGRPEYAWLVVNYTRRFHGSFNNSLKVWCVKR